MLNFYHKQIPQPRAPGTFFFLHLHTVSLFYLTVKETFFLLLNFLQFALFFFSHIDTVTLLI